MKRENANWIKPLTRLGKEPLIHRVLDISTLHISLADMRNLEANQEGLTAYKYEYGFFVLVPELKELNDYNKLPEPWSDCMRKCIGFAQRLKCSWIKFDQDGDVYEENVLPQAGWT